MRLRERVDRLRGKAGRELEAELAAMLREAVQRAEEEVPTLCLRCYPSRRPSRLSES
jgi:hypothetical protein